MDTDAAYVQYDGHTVALQASHAVMPDSVYHMKLAIADGSDFIFDSGVFLATGALGSLRLGDSFAADGGATSVIEGCANGTVTFTRDPITLDTLWLDLLYSSSAASGDFTSLPDRIAILPGEASADLVLEAVEDGFDEAEEELIIDLYNSEHPHPA